MARRYPSSTPLKRAWLASALFLTALVAGAQFNDPFTQLQQKMREIPVIGSVPTNGDVNLLGGTPVNDLCSGATIVTLSEGSSVVRTGDNTGATVDGFLGVPVVWEAFTVTGGCLDVSVSYCGTTPPFLGAVPLLVVGCPINNLVYIDENTVTQECADGNFVITFTQLVPRTYYFPVLAGSGSTGPYVITFDAVACTSTPQPNDECTAPIVILPSPDCVPVSGDVNGGPNGSYIPGNGCSGGDGSDDIWFSFTATATNHTITVAPSAQMDVSVELRTNDCPNTTLVQCRDVNGTGDAEVMQATGLTIGQTYQLRLYDWYSGIPVTTGLTVCVQGPAPTGCFADAGTITADDASVCLVDGSASLSATPGSNSVVPSGFSTIYVLTQGPGLVIEDAGPAPVFDVTAAGEYTIHTLVYDPTTLDLSIVELGVTTGFDVNALLVQGGGTICASLDVAGAPVTVEECVDCTADAGTLTADDALVCFEEPGVLISATADGNSVAPVGYETLFVLTAVPGLVILDANTAPEFTVNGVGTYAIHTLVYDPLTLDLSIVEFGVTTAVEVNTLLIQGGGSICASLDLVGATVQVEECVECDADAGSLTADAATVCLTAGEATLTAVADGNSVVPVGFETIYVLTQGVGLVIVDAAATPDFVVNTAGLYTIHTLVYDPNTLDLGIVEFGTTTGVDVLNLLIQGGGTICASLDVAGAPITVEECVICDVDAGALTADEDPACLVGGAAQISATPDGNSVVPTGYETLYVLTQGAGLVIQDAAATPAFEVNAIGDYTIHTLVYDPNTLDLSIVEFGVTTGFDVNALLIQGGGSICAALDVTGASITVEVCIPCDADAGTITADASFVCLVAGAAQLSATPDGNSSFPIGFTTLYVLTEGAGLTIQGVSTTPVFEVSALGDYTIHTLVYDPNTLDLSIVEIGVTTGFDVNGLLIQGGGTICASLDVAGAPISVEECDCDGGEVTTSDGLSSISICQDADADVIAFQNNSTSSDNYAYVLTGADNIIVSLLAGNSLDFNSAALGIYRVWGISYSGVLIGADPGASATAITSTGACAELSSVFVRVTVEICTGINEAQTSDWNVFPNPTDGHVTLTFGATNGFASVDVLDLGGRLVHQTARTVTSGQHLVMDLTGVAPGTYMVRVRNAQGTSTRRMVIR